MKYLINPIYQQMGFDEKKDESHVQLLHRTRIVGHACNFGIDRCINRAQLIFREWMSDKNHNM